MLAQNRAFRRVLNLLKLDEATQQALLAGKLAEVTASVATRAPELTVQPTYITKYRLRDYQLEGVRWMLGKHNAGTGAILGDEMGLGKTLQVGSFLSVLHHECGLGPFLVVAPLSVLSTWMQELDQCSMSGACKSTAGPRRRRRTPSFPRGKERGGGNGGRSRREMGED